MPDLRITSISFEEEAIMVSYYDRGHDLREPGVMQTHDLLIPRGFDYDDEIAAVEDAVKYLIGDVMDDWTDLPKIGEGRRSEVPLLGE